jgi:Protein of unknown function (DUF3572)
MNRDAAATISLRVLAFLAGEEGRRQRFLNLTGITPETLASLASRTHFQAAVLEYLLADEPLLLEFCRTEHLDPTLPVTALSVLAGLGWDQAHS